MTENETKEKISICLEKFLRFRRIPNSASLTGKQDLADEIKLILNVDKIDAEKVEVDIVEMEGIKIDIFLSGGQTAKCLVSFDLHVNFQE